MIKLLISLNNYLLLQDETSSCFKFGEYGFVEDGTGDPNEIVYYVKDGYINANYLLDVAKCNELFTDLSAINLSLSLSYSNPVDINGNNGLFKDFEIVNAAPTNPNSNTSLNTTWNFSVTLTIGDTPIVLPKPTISDIHNYEVEYNIGSLLNTSMGQIPLSIQYHWYLEAYNNYFKNNIYPKIYDIEKNQVTLEFSHQASLSGN